MSTKKSPNSPENTSTPSEDNRGISLRARRGIRSKRAIDVLPLTVDDNNEGEKMPIKKKALKDTQDNISKETLDAAPAKKRGRPARATKESPKETAAEEIVSAPKKRGRPKKTQNEKAVAEKKNQTTEEPKEKQAKAPAKKTVKEAKEVPQKEKTKARSQAKKKSKNAAKSEQESELEEVLSALKEPAEASPEPLETQTASPQEKETEVSVESYPSEKPLTFRDLGLSENILTAIEELGYKEPTPIQTGTIPHILAGKDVLGVAQTGTGKTASFILPLLEKLSKTRARARMPRCLILEPTRELALQVAENIKKYGKHLNLNHALLIGGNSMNEQKDTLQRGVDILIVTPGRLIDHFERGGLLLNQTDLLVIDEADRMLDMGFIPDIEKITSLLSHTRQTLFFSATMAPAIKQLADKFLQTPEEITISPQSSVSDTISEFVFFIEKDDKHRAIRRLLQTELIQSAIIFCNRKRDVDLLFHYLNKHHFSVGHLHGDLEQNIRFETLERFRAGELRVLVCSDVAARGIDISNISHVFNYDLPSNAEDYVHRIGRTGRAGNTGCAFSFVDPEEIHLLEAIEELIRKPIEQAVIEGFKNAIPDSHIVQPQMEQTLIQPLETELQEETPPLEEKEEISPAPAKEAPQKKSEAPQENIPEYGTSLPLDKNGFLPAISEKDSIQKGFGEYTPSFMKISFPPQSRSFPVA